MKAPDKIYVAISKFMCPGLASSSKLKDNLTEYIRKDALLEWLNGLIKDCENSNSYVLGLTSLAYQDLVNKIESL